MSEHTEDYAFAQSFDARDWAKAFVETVREHPGVPTSEGAMIGWFANALMRGHDEASRKAERRVAEVEARYAPLVQAVREWQEAYRADPLSDDAGIRYGKARRALLALPLPGTSSGLGCIPRSCPSVSGTPRSTKRSIPTRTFSPPSRERRWRSTRRAFTPSRPRERSPMSITATPAAVDTTEQRIEGWATEAGGWTTIRPACPLDTWHPATLVIRVPVPVIEATAKDTGAKFQWVNTGLSGVVCDLSRDCTVGSPCHPWACYTPDELEAIADVMRRGRAAK